MRRQSVLTIVPRPVSPEGYTHIPPVFLIMHRLLSERLNIRLCPPSFTGFLIIIYTTNQAAIVLWNQIGDNLIMDLGQTIYILSRLILGALASFFAIMLWSKTRDVAWMLMVIGTIAAYVETVYSILNIFGISGTNVLTIGSMSLMSILLPSLPTVFFIATLLVMVIRKYRRR